MKDLFIVRRALLTIDKYNVYFFTGKKNIRRERINLNLEKTTIFQ